MVEVKTGSKVFRQKTGADNSHVRVMEAAGVISPSKTESGWRQFSASDIAAARKWLAEHRRKRA